jgi:regulator of chromosome condensation
LENKKIYKICSGLKHTLLLDFNSNLYSFGFNDFSQLGVNKQFTSYSSNPILINNNIQDISCGKFHNLILNNGKAYSFGLNNVKYITIK